MILTTRRRSRFFDSTPHDQLVTSDYVFNEVMNLFNARGEVRRGLEIGRQLLEGKVGRLVWVDKTDVYKAWTYFESYRAKNWSFTDCISRSIMERLQIDTAFAFDQHFREFGNVTVIP